MRDWISDEGIGQRHSLLVTLALATSSFLTQFDVTAVVIAMPAIARDLGFGVAGFAWIIDAYSLAFTGTLLAAGALADRFGRRWSMLGGNAVFLLASIGCGIATTGPALFAARVLQGAGAAFMVTGALALVATSFPGAGQRTRAFGVIGVISGVAMALGPTLGSFLASWFGWRWIFLANIPFCAALALAVPRLVAETRDPKGRPLDPIGVALLTASLGLAIDTLLRHDASLVTRAACLVVSVTGAVLFGWRQWRSPHPLLDPRVFATSAMAGVGALLTAIQFGYWGMLVYLPLFLNAGLGMSLEFAGVVLLAATLPMLLVPPIGGRLATQHGWRLFFTVAFAVMLLGDASLAISALSETPSTRLLAAAVGMLGIGVGAALANPQLSGVAIALAPPAQAGMAAAVMMIVRQGGFAISIATLGAVLGTASDAAGFARPFTLAALAALLGIVAALTLLPPKST